MQRLLYSRIPHSSSNVAAGEQRGLGADHDGDLARGVAESNGTRHSCTGFLRSIGYTHHSLQQAKLKEEGVSMPTLSAIYVHTGKKSHCRSVGAKAAGKVRIIPPIPSALTCMDTYV